MALFTSSLPKPLPPCLPIFFTQKKTWVMRSLRKSIVRFLDHHLTVSDTVRGAFPRRLSIPLSSALQNTQQIWDFLEVPSCLPPANTRWCHWEDFQAIKPMGSLTSVASTDGPVPADCTEAGDALWLQRAAQAGNLSGAAQESLHR